MSGEAGFEATQRIRELARRLTGDDLVLVLISGGASALLVEPIGELTLKEKSAIHEQLLLSGASVAEMNCVRKHISAIKGGRLAKICEPAQVVMLVISDVPGDDVATIGSGPTLPDDTTCEEALRIINRYSIRTPGSLFAIQYPQRRGNP